VGSQTAKNLVTAINKLMGAFNPHEANISVYQIGKIFLLFYWLGKFSLR
jgi:hypothetical protein